MIYLFSSVCMIVLLTCIYVHHMCAGYLRRSEKAQDSRELELGIVLRHHMGAGDGIQSGARVSEPATR